MSVGKAGPESAAGGPRSLSGPGWRRFPVQRGWRAGGPERRRRRPPTDNESGGALLSGGGESDAGLGAGRASVMDNQVRSLRPGLASRCPARRCGRPCAHTAPRAPGLRAPIWMGPSPATATPGRPSPIAISGCPSSTVTHVPLPHRDPRSGAEPLGSISVSQCHSLHTGEFFVSVVYPHRRGILRVSAWLRAL